MQQLREGRDEVGRAAYRILRDAVHGEFGGDEKAAYVGAAALNVHAFVQAKEDLTSSGTRRRLAALGGAGARPGERAAARLAETVGCRGGVIAVC